MDRIRIKNLKIPARHGVYEFEKEKEKFVDKVEAKTKAITEFIDNRINEVESKEKNR